MSEQASGPMDGVKVVEIGLWLAGPSCAAILADWGAEVVKVEPIDGDPFRGYAFLFGGEVNPPFELDNRGKRSIAVDLRAPKGRQVALDLIADADVVVTSYRPAGLERLGLDWASVPRPQPSGRVPVAHRLRPGRRGARPCGLRHGGVLGESRRRHLAHAGRPAPPLPAGAAWATT